MKGEEESTRRFKIFGMNDQKKEEQNLNGANFQTELKFQTKTFPQKPEISISKTKKEDTDR